MNRLKWIWFGFTYGLSGIIWWLFVRPFTKFRKETKAIPLPEWENNLKLVEFKKMIWSCEMGMGYQRDPTFYGIKDWLAKNVVEYKLLEGEVMGEEYLQGVYMNPEDILVFKIIWGQYI